MNMREVKFRAWNTEEQIMCYDNEDNSECYWDGVVASSVSLINSQLSNRRTYEYMQFIGFCDDDATPVYEGDIVEYDGKNYIVFWDSYQFNLKGFREYWRDSPYDAFSESLSFKVVGNVYEHPNMTVEEGF